MHLSLPHKIFSTPRAQHKPNQTRRTWAWLAIYVVVFSLCVMLGACSSQPKPVDVGMVVQPNKVAVGPLPQVVAETKPLPVGYFQCRRLARETKKTTTPSTPTASMPPTCPAAPTP